MSEQPRDPRKEIVDMIDRLLKAASGTDDQALVETLVFTSGRALGIALVLAGDSRGIPEICTVSKHLRRERGETENG